MKLSQLLEEVRSVTRTTENSECCDQSLTIASFIDSHPEAKDVIGKVMDMMEKGLHSEALGFLDKEHQDIKDKVMTVVYLQPQIAAMYPDQGKPLNTNES